MRKTLYTCPPSRLCLPPTAHRPARQLNLFATTKICVQVICNRFYSGACDCSSLSGKSSLLCLERKKKRKREGDEEKGEERCGTPPTHQCPSATTAHPIPPPEPNLACMDVPTCDNRDMGLYPKHSKPSPWRGDAVSKLEKFIRSESCAHFLRFLPRTLQNTYRRTFRPLRTFWGSFEALCSWQSMVPCCHCSVCKHLH